MLEKQHILSSYYKDQIKLHWIFCAFLVIVLLAGYLIFTFSDHPIYSIFAKVLLISSPILIVRYAYNLVVLKGALRSIIQSGDTIEAKHLAQLDKRQVEIKDHARIISILLIIISILAIPGCYFFPTKLIISLVIGLLLPLSLEYIFQYILDYQLYECKYRLERKNEPPPND